MSPRSGAPREVALPVTVFDAFRAEIEKDVGTLDAVTALHRGGYAAGLGAALGINREVGGDAFELPEARFWAHLTDYFSKRGWGSLEHRSVHPAIGILSSSDWAEASTDTPSDGCAVSAGFLSGLLSQLAGAAVAVLEVRCRCRGDDSCDFAFGSEAAIHDLYGQLLEGRHLEQALEAL